VDLRFHDAQPSAAERAAVDTLLGAPQSGWEGGARGARDSHTAAGGHAARDQRHLLLPAFHAVTARVGWVSEGAFNYICERLTVPPAEAYGVITFYALLSTTPRPPRVVHVCDDIACRAAGANAMCAELEKKAGPAYHAPHGDHYTIPESGWMTSPCLGLCDQAPAALVTSAGEVPIERLFGAVDATGLARVLQGDLAPATRPRRRLPQAGDPSLRILRRVDVIDAASLD